MSKTDTDLVKITGSVTVAFLSNNAAKPADVVRLIRSVHAALVELSNGDQESPRPLPGPVQKPAILISASINPDYVTCLECGKKLRSMRFHIAKHGLSPDGYRAKWALDREYPMAAPNFAAKRSAIALESQFGTYRKNRKTRRSLAG